MTYTEAELIEAIESGLGKGDDELIVSQALRLVPYEVVETIRAAFYRRNGRTPPPLRSELVV